MKIRNGFVSNSSSSSFIISTDKPKDLKMTIELDVSNFLEETIKTEDHLKSYFIDRFGLEYSMNEGTSFEDALEEECETDTYKASLEDIKNGKTVLVLFASNDDESMILYEHGIPESDDYTIIFRGE